jgi:hypothetical protein
VQGTPATISLIVTVLDASGAAIFGGDPFSNPVTLSDSDTSGATKLSNATLNSPVDAGAVTVAYSGAAIAPAVFSASATGVAAANVTPATLTPVTPGAFVDWPTYGYDTERTGFNPSTTGITPGSIANFRVAWETQIQSASQSQPIVVTNIAGHKALLIVAAFAIAQAYDASTGALVWSTTLPTQDGQTCGVGAISGTAAYDKALGSIFMVAGNGVAPNHVVLYELSAATGAIIGQVDTTGTPLPGEATYSHTGVNLANGQIYFGTGSDCEGTATGNPSWRGRVIEVNPASMTVTNTFYTTWNQGGPWGGGGVWAWGGVSADVSGNVFASTGNGEDAQAISPQTSVPAPFTFMPNEYSAYAEQLIELNAGLATVEGSNSPGFNFAIGQQDLDYTGVPVVAEANAAMGCGEFTATMGKGGELVTNSPSQGLGIINRYSLSVPTAAGYFMGNPGYSPLTGYVYAPIPTSGAGSLGYPPGMAAIGNCGSAILWNVPFGPDSALYAEAPRSAPTVTAGGVVFMGTPCTNNSNGGCGAPSGAANGALWAVDASAGTLLNNGNPLLITADNIRMAPSADGLWLFLMDDSGNLYGLTVDPTVTAIKPTAKRRVTNPLHIHNDH